MCVLLGPKLEQVCLLDNSCLLYCTCSSIFFNYYVMELYYEITFFSMDRELTKNKTRTKNCLIAKRVRGGQPSPRLLLSAPIIIIICFLFSAGRTDWDLQKNRNTKQPEGSKRLGTILGLIWQTSCGPRPSAPYPRAFRKHRQIVCVCRLLQKQAEIICLLQQIKIRKYVQFPALSR